MLNFFRKNQRFFFIVVTIVIVMSFSFFGTFSSFVNELSVSDDKMGKAVDGSDLSQRELHEMVRFLGSSIQDATFLGREKLPNLLNDDVVRKDFLLTGRSDLLLERYFSILKPDLEERLARIKNFSSYVHPEAAFINAASVWQKLQPEAFQMMTFLKEECQTVDPHFFTLLSRLALEQPHLPGEMVRRILLYQQNQYSWIKPDEGLYFANLNPFGFENLEDWLGKKYLQLIAQFIINAAKIAEKRGYHISKEEVKAELLQNMQQGLSALRLKSNPTDEDAQALLPGQLRMVGLDDQRAVQLWKKVMLFRRLFNDVASFTLVDPLPFEAFNAYANEGVVVEQYGPADALQFRDFRTLLQFQCYLESIFGVSRYALSLPTNFPSLQEVEKRAPELVERKCLLEWKEVKKEEIAQRITLKETWEWEGEEENWQLLREKFPSLAKQWTTTAMSRLALLDALDMHERLKIDHFARMKILENHPEWIQEALERVERKKEEVSIRLKGERAPFHTGLTGSVLIERLSQNSTLELLSSDENTLYHISVLEMKPYNEVLTFGEALSDGTLTQLLEARLEEIYPEMRKKNLALFQKPGGEWKPLHEVVDQLGVLVYAPLLKAIEEDWKQAGHELPRKEGDQSLEFYTAKRLYSWMRSMRTQIISASDDQKFLSTGAAFADQWKLKKSERLIKRGERSAFSKEELFALPVGGWSTVAVELGQLSFCQLMKRGSGESTQQSEKLAKEALAQEACTALMVQLLDQMAAHQSIGLLQ